MQGLLIAFGVAVAVCWLIVGSSGWHGGKTGDGVTGVQKFHTGVVPRVGGVALMAALAASVVWGANAVGASADADDAVGWLVAALPAFAAGLAEDITKRVGVLARLLATMAAAALGAWWLGAVLPRLDVPGVDALMAWTPMAWAVTLVAVAGVANAVNIVDGFNGLAAGVSVLMFAAFGYVAWTLGDALILQVCLAMIGALMGFLVWNYPKGRIFLGDGGAYLTGFMLAEVAVLLVVRHPAVSPWFGLLVCAYPVTETLFSIYRKRILRGTSPGVPDGIHFHMLIYRRVVRWRAGADVTPPLQTARNAATSPYLWALAGLAIVPAVLWWRQPAVLAACFAAFVLLYVAAYRGIVRFRVPRGLRRRVG